jgi:hypothetical protein
MKNVFLVGCSRSGTTWLQLLLYQHPQIATIQETHLFDWYIEPLYQIYKKDCERNRARKIGLSEIFSSEEFDSVLRLFVQKTLNKINNYKDSATVILEKTPEHVRSWRLIRRLLPDSYFIHIIRDPRSVVASMVEAKKQWNSATAPIGGIAGATKRWIVDVEEGRRIKYFSKNYLEIRYENLLTQGSAELEKVLTFLEIEYDKNFIEKALHDCSISNLKQRKNKVKAPWSLDDEPKNFYRKGTIDAWKQDLSLRQLRQIEYLAHELMDDLGYIPITQTKYKPIEVICYEIGVGVVRKTIIKIPEPVYKFIRTLFTR